jgi:uncharacterized protein YdeI (YjbR/CyaY-like superfamily)
VADRALPRARFFAQQEQLRAWFEKNHSRATELWIGYYKRGSDPPGVTYAEAVEVALCFGWIDGQVRSLDKRRYANRYTPRRPGSRWSQTNVAKVNELIRAGAMHPAGLKKFRERDPAQRAGYSFEERPFRLEPTLLREFQAAGAAWKYFRSQPAGYQRTAIFWVMSGRLPQTRGRRLQVVIRDSSEGRRVASLTPGTNRRNS